MSKNNEEDIKKIPSIPARIYLMCYPDPKTKTEIKNSLYKKDYPKSRKQYVEEVVPKLVKDKMIIPLKPEKDEKNKSLYHINYKLNVLIGIAIIVIIDFIGFNYFVFKKKLKKNEWMPKTFIKTGKFDIIFVCGQ